MSLAEDLHSQASLDGAAAPWDNVVRAEQALEHDSFGGLTTRAPPVHGRSTPGLCDKPMLAEKRIESSMSCNGSRLHTVEDLSSEKAVAGVGISWSFGQYQSYFHRRY